MVKSAVGSKKVATTPKRSAKKQVRRSAVASSRVHRSKTRMFLFRPRTAAQKVMLVVILLAIVSVVVALAVGWFLAPERAVKGQIAGLAENYYEEHFYPEIVERAPDLSATMEKYVETGFTGVSLLQLMVEKKGDNFDSLLQYCDSNDTLVVFYPYAPYGKGDYRVEYKYACSF